MLASMAIMNFQLILERQLDPGHQGLDYAIKKVGVHTVRNGEIVVGFVIRTLPKLIQKINCKTNV